MSGQVLTGFYLSTGTPLIQGVCMAGFACLQSLDKLGISLLNGLSYVNKVWHGSCNV